MEEKSEKLWSVIANNPFVFQGYAAMQEHLSGQVKKKMHKRDTFSFVFVQNIYL